MTPLESSLDELEDYLDPLTFDPEVLDSLHQENMELQPGKSLSDTRPVWSYIEGLCDGHEDEDMASGTSILPIKRIFITELRDQMEDKQRSLRCACLYAA